MISISKNVLYVQVWWWCVAGHGMVLPVAISFWKIWHFKKAFCVQCCGVSVLSATAAGADGDDGDGGDGCDGGDGDCGDGDDGDDGGGGADGGGGEFCPGGCRRVWE